MLTEDNDYRGGGGGGGGIYALHVNLRAACRFSSGT